MIFPFVSTVHTISDETFTSVYEFRAKIHFNFNNLALEA